MANVLFKVFRFDPDKDRVPRFDKFEVPVKPLDSVLSGLFYIQNYLDGSLSFRFSCRGAVCGSCAMHINGKYRLACEIQIASLNSDLITVQPLAHLPILKDLVVDMTRFWGHYERIKPYLLPGTPEPEKERIQSPEERERLGDTIDCILCGACYGACTVTATDNDYIGPAALLKVDRFLRDSRDGGKEERLDIIDGLHGLWRCHSIMNCQEVCPKEISPAFSIHDMRKRITMRRIGFI